MEKMKKKHIKGAAKIRKEIKVLINSIVFSCKRGQKKNKLTVQNQTLKYCKFSFCGFMKSKDKINKQKNPSKLLTSISSLRK